MADMTLATAGVLLALFLMVYPLNAEQQLPSGFIRCPKEDAAFETCMINSFPAAIQQLAPGMPSFGTPPLDPLHIPYIGLGQTGTSNPVNLNINFTNIYIHGLRKLLGDKAPSSLSNYKISLEGHIPDIYVEGDYVMDGKFLVVPVTGKGQAHCNLTMMRPKLTVEGKENIKNGKVYMKVTNATIDLQDVDHMSFYFDNLFNGDKVLGDATNAVINDNWRVFWAELRPAFEETLRFTTMEVARRIFNRVAYDDAFAP